MVRPDAVSMDWSMQASELLPEVPAMWMYLKFFSGLLSDLRRYFRRLIKKLRSFLESALRKLGPGLLINDSISLVDLW